MFDSIKKPRCIEELLPDNSEQLFEKEYERLKAEGNPELKDVSFEDFKKKMWQEKYWSD